MILTITALGRRQSGPACTVSEYCCLIVHNHQLITSWAPPSPCLDDEVDAADHHDHDEPPFSGTPKTRGRRQGPQPTLRLTSRPLPLPSTFAITSPRSHLHNHPSPERIPPPRRSRRSDNERSGRGAGCPGEAGERSVRRRAVLHTLHRTSGIATIVLRMMKMMNGTSRVWVFGVLNDRNHGRDSGRADPTGWCYGILVRSQNGYGRRGSGMDQAYRDLTFRLHNQPLSLNYCSYSVVLSASGFLPSG